MKNILIVLLFVSFSSLSQEAKIAEDYKLINKMLTFVQNRYLLEKVYLYKETVNNFDDYKFYTSDRLASYEARWLRIEKDFKNLLSTLQEEGMGPLVRPTIVFNKKKLNPGVEIVQDMPDLKQHNQHFALSAPVFSKNRNFAFLFYYKPCMIPCQSWQLVIFKNVDNEWYAIEQLGIPF